jgi:hypothetical protein
LEYQKKQYNILKRRTLMAANIYEKLALINMLKDWGADVLTLHTAVQASVSDVTSDDDPDFYALTQSPGGAVNMTLESPAVPDVPRKVTLTSEDDCSGVTFTVEGTDRDDAAITDTGITGPNASTVSSPKFYKTVTRIAVSGACTNVSAGFGEVDSEPLYDTYLLVKGFSGSIPQPTLTNALTSIKADAEA